MIEIKNRDSLLQDRYESIQHQKILLEVRWKRSDHLKLSVGDTGGDWRHLHRYT